MGESKRRRQLDPNYGQPKIPDSSQTNTEKIQGGQSQKEILDIINNHHEFTNHHIFTATTQAQ